MISARPSGHRRTVAIISVSNQIEAIASQRWRTVSVRTCWHTSRTFPRISRAGVAACHSFFTGASLIFFTKGRRHPGQSSRAVVQGLLQLLHH
uniref:Uncharacterized protein n=1 Tax=uncultured marine virus TaxID=186617 RepID=A0A0F7KZU8_9VIRU|nr:hypothetical protein [uncultured marine virus]